MQICLLHIPFQLLAFHTIDIHCEYEICPILTPSIPAANTSTFNLLMYSIITSVDVIVWAAQTIVAG